MSSKEPTDAPPSYEKATAHATRNGITPQARRSMEDERRALPEGWVRQYDTEQHHQFFVDTTKSPPRAIWHHPYDDDEYLSSISAEERANIDRLQKSVSLKDIQAESSDDEAGPSELPPRPNASSSASGQPSGVHRWGRKLKDKITSSTHEERERDRQERARQEQKAYETHLAYRRAMSRAIETGQPQLLGKDSNGRDVYIQPPTGPSAGYYGGNGYGYDPYSRGPYAGPRYVRPNYGYSRPYGYGYGGGLGLPIAGGLLGGALLGAALF